MTVVLHTTRISTVKVNVSSNTNRFKIQCRIWRLINTFKHMFIMIVLKWLHFNLMAKNTQTTQKPLINSPPPLTSDLPYPWRWPLEQGFDCDHNMLKNNTSNMYTNNTYWHHSQQSEHHGPRKKDYKTSSMGEQHLPCKTTMSQVQRRIKQKWINQNAKSYSWAS